MNKLLGLLVACLIANGALSPVRAQNDIEVIPAGDAKVYGEYPIAYQEIITRWLGTKLADPASAVIEWPDAPKPGEYVTLKRQRFVGYVVDFKVNARNAFGAYTGKQKYRAVIRNGDVVWGGRPRY
ncbi:MAG: hypothetical protein ABR526_11125 [Chthoniobacterales bacterium]